MTRLLAAIDAYGGDQPVLLGGDFNTSTASRGWARGTGERQILPAARLLDPVPYEPLFEVAAAQGYDWRACNTQGVPTQRTRPDGTPPPPFGRIDWFFSRGLVASDAADGRRGRRRGRRDLRSRGAAGERAPAPLTGSRTLD